MPNYRKYGCSPFNMVLIHGGPGAAGSMAPVANVLSQNYGILEPFQTGLTIEEQIQELNTFLEVHSKSSCILIGHSWGAWLGYMYAARYPFHLSKLIMIGSGPFLEEYARNIENTRMKRLNVNERTELSTLLASLDDPANRDQDRIFRRAANLIRKADSFHPVDISDTMVQYRYDIFKSIWKEAVEMRKSGELLTMARKIRCPVIAIHGDYDPHPAEGVKKIMSPLLKDFIFVLLKNCGHEPWNEKFAKDEFYQILSNL